MMLNVMAVGMACSLAAAAAVQAAQPGQADRDRIEVVAVAQRFLEALSARNAAGLSAALLPGGQAQSIREEKGQWVVRTTAFEEMVKSISGNTSRILERMWNPEVRVFGRIATVSAPYDFHLDGAFSHCGTDVFDLVKTPDGWRISGVLYTVERQGCQPSPLGPPK